MATFGPEVSRWEDCGREAPESDSTGGRGEREEGGRREGGREGGREVGREGGREEGGREREREKERSEGGEVDTYMKMVVTLRYTP